MKTSNKNKKTLRQRTKRTIRFYYLRILRLDDSTEKIARGAALGAFIGLMPTLGIGLILCVVLSFLLKVNKAAAVIASFVMNPFTAPLVWSFSVTLGNFIFWRDSAFIFYGASYKDFLHEIGHIPLIFVTGNTVIASFFSILIYFIVKKGVIRRRARKAAIKLKREALNSTELTLKGQK